MGAPLLGTRGQAGGRGRWCRVTGPTVPPESGQQPCGLRSCVGPPLRAWCVGQLLGGLGPRTGPAGPGCGAAAPGRPCCRCSPQAVGWGPPPEHHAPSPPPRTASGPARSRSKRCWRPAYVRPSRAWTPRLPRRRKKKRRWTWPARPPTCATWTFEGARGEGAPPQGPPLSPVGFSLCSFSLLSLT